MAANFQPPQSVNAATAPSTGFYDPANGPATAGTPGGPPAGSTSSGPPSGTAAVQAILDLIGMGTATANDGSSLASWLLSSATTSGLDPTTADPTALQAYVDTVLPKQKAYQDRFPGIIQQLAAGQNPITPANYMTLEDTARGLATQYGLNPDLIASSANVANWVVGNVSPSEISARFNTYVDAYESAPAAVQNAYAQFYGPNSLTAFASHIADTGVTDDALKQQMETAQVAGAAAQLGVSVDQSTASKLVGLGVSYQSALTAAQKTVQEQGLYTQSMGEQSQSTGPGATAPLTQQEVFASASKVAAAGATGSAAGPDAAVQQEIENRENQFRGGGGATASSLEGFAGLGAAKPA